VGERYWPGGSGVGCLCVNEAWMWCFGVCTGLVGTEDAFVIGVGGFLILEG
jgi:hypothetical protein